MCTELHVSWKSVMASGRNENDQIDVWCEIKV